jgi:thiol-disulfide isomerase/thioredoxin
MKSLPLLFCSLLAAGLATAAGFRGRLDPRVEPGTRVLMPVEPAPAAVVAALPAPPPSTARVWSLKRPFTLKDRTHLIAVVATADGAKTLWVDRDGDGKFGAAESWPFPADQPSVSLTLPWDQGIYTSYPLTVECHTRELRRPDAPPAPAAAPDPTTVVALTYNFNIGYQGAVEVDGQPLRLWFSPRPPTFLIDPASQRVSLDANRNGQIEVELGEAENGSGKAPVFRVGPHYLAVVSADVRTGDILLESRPASDYTRFDANPGQEMPDFTFTTHAGATHKLSDFRGQHVLLDFWGTWCGPCIEEMKHLDPLYAQYHARGFEIISLNMEKTSGRLSPEDYAKGEDKVRAFFAKAGHQWLSATQRSIERFALDVIHVSVYPTCILVGPDGKVITRTARADELAKLLAQAYPGGQP